MTRIWFPYRHNGLSPAKGSAMTRKVERESWALAEHYVRVGHGDKAPAFFKSAKAPTINPPSFGRELREVLIYDKYGAMKDFTESQARELALEARNKFRFGGKKIEEAQNALFDILQLSLKYDSKVMPAQTVVSWLLNHARTPEEVGGLLARAEKLGYKVDLKRDILGAIKTPYLGGVFEGRSHGEQARRLGGYLAPRARCACSNAMGGWTSSLATGPSRAYDVGRPLRRCCRGASAASTSMRGWKAAIGAGSNPLPPHGPAADLAGAAQAQVEAAS